jgi:YIF1 protein
VLGLTATSAFIFIVIELFLIKLSCYLMGVGDSLHILDFLSLIGYNFVGLIVTMLVKFLMGETAKYAAFVYTSISMSIYVVMLLGNHIILQIASFIKRLFPARLTDLVECACQEEEDIYVVCNCCLTNRLFLLPFVKTLCDLLIKLY